LERDGLTQHLAAIRAADAVGISRLASIDERHTVERSIPRRDQHGLAFGGRAVPRVVFR
jgi:hypothetical protein